LFYCQILKYQEDMMGSSFHSFQVDFLEECLVFLKILWGIHHVGNNIVHVAVDIS
jgi:hypothetical protein